MGPGFDLLRLGLALLILFSHCSAVFGHAGTTAWLHELLHGAPPPLPAASAPVAAPPAPANAAMGVQGYGLTGLTGPFIRALVPMFFILSGFLVTGSAARTTSLFRFLGLRALRILPALLVEVLLSAIILGVVFTTLPLGRYFSDPMFWRYFLNIVGVVQFHLPGVFENSRDPVVNANLWTMPYELESYALMSALILFGLLGRRTAMTILFALLTALLILANSIYGIQARVEVFDGRTLVYCFLCGVMAYSWRDRIAFRPLWFVASFLICYALLLQARALYVVPVFLTYFTICIGLMPLPQFRLIRSGDYSYGIYLYGYPVSQAIAHAGGREVLDFWTGSLLVGLATAAFALLSWHGVEKHFLKLKRFISGRSAAIAGALHPDIAPPPAAP